MLREAVACGVNHIDTSDFYGPHVTNQIIREALHPYPDDLLMVTKGRRGARGDDASCASWRPAFAPEQLERAVENNLRNLELEAHEIVNQRVMIPGTAEHSLPGEGSVEAMVAVLARLRQRGLIGHLGLSNVTSAQVAEARTIAPLVCVQNQYNLVQRGGDALGDELAAAGIAYVPFFPLGGFSPIQSRDLPALAAEVRATPMQLALARLLHRPSNILPIPRTS